MTNTTLSPMNLVALRLAVALLPAAAMAGAPIASSSFAGAEDPLFENGAWAALTSLSPNGGRLQKDNAAFPDPPSPDPGGARTTAPLPAGHYSQILGAPVGTS